MRNTIENALLIKELEELESRVRDLRLRVEEGQGARTQSPTRGGHRVQVGDKVRILNPRPFQDKEGEVLKVNEETDYVSILGRKKKRTITRKRKNVLKIEFYSEEE